MGDRGGPRPRTRELTNSNPQSAQSLALGAREARNCWWRSKALAGRRSGPARARGRRTPQSRELLHVRNSLNRRGPS
eukprot:9384112-Alexandrium_andersonii.AAC.1